MASKKQHSSRADCRVVPTANQSSFSNRKSNGSRGQRSTTIVLPVTSHSSCGCGASATPTGEAQLAHDRELIKSSSTRRHPTLSVDTPQNRGEGDYRGWGLGGMGDGNATSASSLRSAASGAGQHAPGAHSLRSFVSRQVRVAQLHLRLVDSSDLREGNQGSIDPVNGRSAVPGDQGNRSDAQGDPRERRMSSSWETVRTQYQALKTISRLTGRAVWVHAGDSREDTPQAMDQKSSQVAAAFVDRRSGSP
jgi:hypothetical protein